MHVHAIKDIYCLINNKTTIINPSKMFFME